MVRYNIRINYGNQDETVMFYFVHKQYSTISKDESDAAFDKAVKEINHIYKDYGRFATRVGIINLFDKFGFEETMR